MTRNELDRYISKDPAADMLWSAGLGTAVGGLVAGAVAHALWPAGSSLSAHALYIYDAGPAAWAAWLQTHDLALRAASSLIPAGIAGITAGIGAAWVTWPRRLRSRVRHIRGPRLISDPAAAAQEGARLSAAEGAEGEQGVAIHPGIRLPLAREMQHILMFGGSGSGKTQVLWTLINDALSRGDKIIIHDTKLDFSAGINAPGGMMIFAPGDARGAPWNIAEDITSMLDAKLVAQICIPDAGGENNFFSGTARLVFVGMIRHCVKKFGRGGWGWRDLAALLELSMSDLNQLLIAAYPLIGTKLGDGKTAESVLLTAIERLDFIPLLAAAWPSVRGGFSVRRWLAGKAGQALVMQNISEFAPLNERLIPAVVELFAARVLSMPDSRARRIWLILDEMSALPKIPRLLDILDRGRSKGVRCVLTAQSVYQYHHRYGSDLTATIDDNCSTKFYLRTSGREGAEYLSASLGEIETDEPTMSVQSDGGRSTSTHRVKRVAVATEEITGLPQASLRGGLFGYLNVAGWNAVLRLHWPVVPAPTPREHFVPAAWTTGIDVSTDDAARKSAEQLRDAKREAQQSQEQPPHIIEQRAEAPQPDPAREQIDEPAAEAGTEAITETAAVVAAAAAVDPVVSLAAHTLDAIADIAEAADAAGTEHKTATTTVTEQQPAQPTLTKRELLKRRLRARASTHEHEQET